MRTSNNFGLGDIEHALGLGNVVSTAQNAQQAIDTLNPKIQWINDHIYQIMLGWFILTMLACTFAIKLSK